MFKFIIFLGGDVVTPAKKSRWCVLEAFWSLHGKAATTKRQDLARNISDQMDQTHKSHLRWTTSQHTLGLDPSMHI